MNKSALIKALQSTVSVVFVKTNGQTREMKAIINPDGKDQYSSSAVSVIDTTTGLYRAIRASSVISINGTVV